MESPFIILTIEDNQAHAELFRRCLGNKKNFIQIHHALDGEEGLDYLNNKGKFSDKSSNPRPNIILLDLMLPKISGLELLEIVKNTDQLKMIPIVIFSSSQASIDVSKAVELGANSYLTKPADFGTFSLLAESVINYWAGWDQLSKIQPYDLKG